MTSSQQRTERPSLSRAVRAFAAIWIGLSMGYAAYAWSHRADGLRDFKAIWWSAKALALGFNPYEAIGPHGRFVTWEIDLPYPLTAMLVLWPTTFLHERTAIFVVFAIATTLLAWYLMRESMAGLAVFLSGVFYFALAIGQWSPLLTAAALAPWLGWLLIAKPTIGFALFLYRPSRVAALGCVALLALSFVVWPTWPSEWWPRASADAMRVHYRSVLMIPGGALVLLALLRWKRPEARLLTALACIPQTLLPYELLPLFLIPKKAWEGITLAALSWAVVILRMEYAVGRVQDGLDYALSARLGVALMYLPALVMVLRRPNEGDTPELFEQLKRWLAVPLRPWKPGTP